MGVKPLAAHAAQLLDQSRQLLRRGDSAGAAAITALAAEAAPGHPAVYNAHGLALLAAGRPNEAARALRSACDADPSAASLRLNLADALRAAGDVGAALDALDSALERDPYLLPALLRQGQWLEAVGDTDRALRAYRALLRAMPAEGEHPPMYAAGIEHARALVMADGQDRLALLDTALQTVGCDLAGLSSSARAYAEQLCGLRKIYVNQPTGPHFPFLPAIEYFDDALFPWFAELEAGTATIRDELLALWREDAPGFDPYVQFDPTMPVNQWAELNHSPRWSAFFLWKDGTRIEENIGRCPGTAAVMERLALLDVPGKSPTVMFSILAPHTHIPAHTGVTNTRTTVHLPLVVPGSCVFRVGGETREWVEGKAWGFDDTIEHEAWNNSDRPRGILIVDAWNPLLTEADRDVVRVAASLMRV